MSSLTIILICVLAISELTFIFTLFVLIQKIQDMKGEYKFFKDIVKINNETINDVYKVMDNHTKYYARMIQLDETYGAQYDKMIEIIEKIDDSYRSLLEAWKHIVEQYDNTYEEFKSCNERLNKLPERPLSSEDEYYIETNDACDIVCCSCLESKCLESDCPVRKVHMGIVKMAKEAEDG